MEQLFDWTGLNKYKWLILVLKKSTSCLNTSAQSILIFVVWGAEAVIIFIKDFDKFVTASSGVKPSET